METAMTDKGRDGVCKRKKCGGDRERREVEEAWLRGRTEEPSAEGAPVA